MLQILSQVDFTIPVEVEGQYHNVYVAKRPGLDEFMKRVGELYEIVTFTASIAKVGEDAPKHVDRERLTLYSTVIRCWTSWISTMSSSTGCSERAAMSMRAITSRTCLRSGGI